MALGNVIKEFVVKATLKSDEKSFDRLDASLAKTAQTAKNLSIAVAGAATTIFGFTKVTGDNARELDNYSRQLGINTGRLQELSFAAEEAAGVGRDELVGALEAVSSTMDQVRRGTISAGHGFNDLGITTEVINDRTIKADQLLAIMADSFRGIQDPIRKAAVAQEVFGGAGAKLIPLLDQGSAGIARLGEEGRRLGAVLDRTAIARGVEFQKTMTRMWTVLKNITFTIGNELFRALGPTFREFQGFLLANRKFIASGIATFVESLGKFLLTVLKGVTFLARRIKFLVKIFGGWEKVTKAIAISIAAIFGAKIFAGIGAITLAVTSLGKAFLFAQLKAAAFPLAVGAAILFLIALLEDLYVFFTGGDSLFGRMTGLNPGPVIDFFVKIGEVINDYFLSPLSKALGLLAKFTNFTTGGLLEGFNPLEAASSAIGAVGNFISGGPGGDAQASGGNQTNNRVNATINVQVPPGTTASEATNIVQEGTSEGMKEALRQTANVNAGGVAY